MGNPLKTKLLPLNQQSIQQAADILRQGGLVAMPTETVYGLAANAFDPIAVGAIFTAKGRPQDNPLIVHIAEVEDLPLVARDIPPAAKKLAREFWPGPLTMVLPRVDAIPLEVSAGLDTVGVRLPAHTGARQLIRAAGVPLAAPSANLSGSPSPTTARHVYNDLRGRIPLVLDGGNSLVGVESTVVSLVGEPTVLRPGFVTREELEEVLQQPVALASSLDKPLEEGCKPASPGMKYKHYAPKAEITIVEGSLPAFTAYVAEQKEIILRDDPSLQLAVLCFEGEAAEMPVTAVCYGRFNDASSQAAALFTALRSLDDLGAHIVFARSPAQGGVGMAVRNRLLRAAAFREIIL